jgi:hypothetical protein
MNEGQIPSSRHALNISRLHFRLKKLKGLESLTEKDFRDLTFNTKEKLYVELFVKCKITSMRDYVMERNRERVLLSK